MLLGPPLLAALLAAGRRALPARRRLDERPAVPRLARGGGGAGRQVLAGDGRRGRGQEFLRADALSTLLAACVAWWRRWRRGSGRGSGRTTSPGAARRFRIFANLFTFTMLFAVTTNNVGFMWVAIEATTITSAMLIPLHVTKASVEASWKYILIGSVGIALAFGGTVLGYFDFVNLAGRQEAALNWTVLMAAAPALHPEVIQLAFVFILIGYGTKAGLAPMHTWLPDAHAEAPAALSAMMSGVLLAVALYAVIRWKAVVNAAVAARFPDRLLIVLGVLSIAIARLQPGDPAELQAHAGVLEHRAHRADLRGAGAGPARDLRRDAAPAQPHAGEVDDVLPRRAGAPSIRDHRDRRACPACSRSCRGPAGCSRRGCWR